MPCNVTQNAVVMKRIRLTRHFDLRPPLKRLISHFTSAATLSLLSLSPSLPISILFLFKECIYLKSASAHILQMENVFILNRIG